MKNISFFTIFSFVSLLLGLEIQAMHSDQTDSVLVKRKGLDNTEEPTSKRPKFSALIDSEALESELLRSERELAALFSQKQTEPESSAGGSVNNSYTLVKNELFDNKTLDKTLEDFATDIEQLIELLKADAYVKTDQGKNELGELERILKFINQNKRTWLGRKIFGRSSVEIVSSTSFTGWFNLLDQLSKLNELKNKQKQNRTWYSKIADAFSYSDSDQ